MISQTNLQPPKNWQDFEMLCLKLWGEIWNVPHEIEFNSDNAQGQQGVDIYAPIDEGLKYFGIQCKNKKLNLIDGSPNRIAKGDVQAEIDKAKTFKPKLSKLIIATSMPKDQQIEEYVRIKSIEHVEQGLFSIQICFWEFFERKILEFSKVHDWYLKNENFYRIKQVELSFTKGRKELMFNPKFQKTIDRYVYRSEEERKAIAEQQEALSGKFGINRMLAAMQTTSLVNKVYDEHFSKSAWHQNFWFKLTLRNTGSAVIEHFKIRLDFEGKFFEVGSETRSLATSPNFKSNVREYSDSTTALLIHPAETQLVQGDAFSTHSIYVKPIPGIEANIKLRWKMLSKDYDQSGELDITIQPVYHQKVIVHEVDSVEQTCEKISFELIQRPSTISPFHGISFLDKDSDYSFE